MVRRVPRGYEAGRSWGKDEARRHVVGIRPAQHFMPPCPRHDFVPSCLFTHYRSGEGADDTAPPDRIHDPWLGAAEWSAAGSFADSEPWAGDRSCIRDLGDGMTPSGVVKLIGAGSCPCAMVRSLSE